MEKKNKKINWQDEIAAECIECGACTEECMLLAEIGEEPASIAARNIEANEAFGCSMCMLCESVCPLDLSPGSMFAQKRIQAVADGEIDINDSRYLFPDRPLNVMNFFRQYYGIDYTDIEENPEAEVGFFPGCTMMAYSEQLTRRVYDEIKKVFGNVVLLDNCCGKPLYQLGLPDRGEANRNNLIEKAKNSGLKKIVVACPNCFYELREIFAGQDVEIMSVYEVIKAPDARVANSVKCTIHDSCPDRFEGILGNQVRSALIQMGYVIEEMEHSKDTTICCGSGGQISHFRPDFTQELLQTRISEAKSTNAEIMIGYCHSCVLNLARNESEVKVRHVLNLILDYEEDYTGVKDLAAQMFDGPEGALNWEKLMAD